MTFKSPTNKEEYFSIVNKYWDDISHILNLYLPTFSHKWIDGSKLDNSLGEYIQELKDTRNPRIARAFSAAYWNIPEDVPNNEIPSFAQFYDLVVMDYRLYEDMEKFEEE